jgi:hypothetical protein
LPESGVFVPEVNAMLKQAGSGRDARLDFWRGLCLIDMVLVHLIYADVQFGQVFGSLVTDYTRFAAGGFVFLSGLCIGRIFLPKVLASIEKTGSGTPVYHRIWIRSLKILLVGYVTTVAFAILNIPTGFREHFNRPMHFVFDVLTFRVGNDLLMLYVAMLAITPLLLELVRRGLWPLIAAVSGIVFYLATRDPRRIELVPGGEFPVMLWQAVFIGGLLFSAPLKAWDQATSRARVVCYGLLTVAFAVVFLSADAAELGLRHRILPWAFVKIPLSFGEMVRYILLTVLIVLGTDFVWHALEHRRLTSFVCLLGRNSLFVYVAHLYVQEIFTALAVETYKWEQWQSIYGIIMISSLGVMAYWFERLSPKGKAIKRPHIRRAAEEPMGHGSLAVTS